MLCKPCIRVKLSFEELYSSMFRLVGEKLFCELAMLLSSDNNPHTPKSFDSFHLLLYLNANNAFDSSSSLISQERGKNELFLVYSASTKRLWCRIFSILHGWRGECRAFWEQRWPEKRKWQRQRQEGRGGGQQCQLHPLLRMLFHHIVSPHPLLF